jgi:hypothetical protein
MTTLQLKVGDCVTIRLNGKYYLSDTFTGVVAGIRYERGCVAVYRVVFDGDGYEREFTEYSTNVKFDQVATRKRKIKGVFKE